MRKLFELLILIFLVVGLPIVASFIVEKLSQAITMNQIMAVAYIVLGINVISFIKDLLRKED